MRTISSRQNPLVRNFRDLAADPDPTGERVLLDGAHLVRDALRAGAEFEVLAVSTSRAGEGEAAALARELAGAGVDVVEVADSVFPALTPVKTSSGIAAIARRRVSTPAMICTHSTAFIVAACDVQDPGNVGSLLRSAEAGGATGAFVCGASANPFSWKALRGSMGSALRLPIVAGMTASAVLTCMRDADVRIIAAVPRDGEPADEIDWRGRVGLFLGGEGPGLDPEIIALAEARVTIPMTASVESLNVAVAAGILVYAARRQRAGNG